MSGHTKAVKFVLGLLVIALILPLTACGGSQDDEPWFTRPTPPGGMPTLSPSPAPDPSDTSADDDEDMFPSDDESSEEPSDDSTTDEESGSAEDESQEDSSTDVSDEASSDTPATPTEPDSVYEMSGTIILVDRDEDDPDRTRNVVVDTRSDDDGSGLKFVHFNESGGKIDVVPSCAKIGDVLNIDIEKENFHPVLLKRGSEPFPSQDELTASDDAVDPEEGSDNYLDPLYGEWGAGDVPVDGRTWTNEDQNCINQE